MTTELTYAIKFVGDMQQAVRFHAEQLGLSLRFQSSEWSEFETGGTTLALHLASSEHPAGTCQLGFGVADIDRFFRDGQGAGVVFPEGLREQFGRRIARFKDTDGAECSASALNSKR